MKDFLKMTTAQSVLVVDDSKTICEIIARELTAAGYFVQTANNGLKAIEILKTEEYKLIITDVDMPEMDGFALIRALSGLSYSPGVILMSGHDEKSLHSAEQLALAYSVNLLATYKKPVPMPSLVAALSKFHHQIQGSTQPHSILSEAEFMRGLMTDGLVPVYQPRVNIQTGEFMGAEVFARWRSPIGSLMGAQAILAVARDKGYMDVLTYRMLELSIEQAGKWKQQGHVIPIAINLTAEYLGKDDFADVASGLVDQYGLDSSDVTLEIGEAELWVDERNFLEVMGRLRIRGFQLALDDFGTGFGSLMRLHSIPFDTLNIDRSLIERARDDETAYIILETIVELTKKLGITSACCGIGSQRLLKLAKDIQIDIVQGFHICTPQKADDLLHWVKNFSVRSIEGS